MTQNQKSQMRQRKQKGQSQWNMYGGTMVKFKHLAPKVWSAWMWRQLPIALMIPLLLIPQAQAQEEEVDGQTKALMHSFVLEFAKISPYLANEKLFTSPDGKTTVGESLRILTKKIKKPSDKLQSSPGFSISYGLLTDHVQKTKEIFDRGEYDYARQRLNSMGNLCSTCHTQSPKISHYSAFEFVIERAKNASFENAEFLFTLRRYDEALPMLDELARGYPKTAVTSDQLADVYRRKLAMFARVYRDPIKATENLKTDLKNPNLPVDVRHNIESWLSTLAKWKVEKTNPAKLKTPQLIEYVAKELPPGLDRRIAPGHPQLLTILRLSGLLYDRLFNEPESPDTQKILYYLSQCERSLTALYWYSLSEIYLKECIVRYPHKPFTAKCFEAYQDGMRERSFGHPMPEGVKASIEALRDYL